MNHQPLSIAVPEHVLSEVAALVAARPNIAGLGMPLGIFFPQFDAFVSHRCAADGVSPNEIDMEAYFSDGLLHLARKMQSLGFFGRYGHMVNVLSYMLRFPAKDFSLLWIPKNSCTSIKAALLNFEPQEAQDAIRPNRFHETVQKSFGVSLDAFVKETFGPLTVLIRHPLDRLVSCYIDKFVKPLKTGRPFEGFARGHIQAAHRHLSLYGAKLERSLSFAEFVEYVLTAPPWTLDAHWRPQADFLCGLAERPGTVFVRSDNFERLAQMVGAASLGERRNASSGKRFVQDAPVTGQHTHVLPADLALDTVESYNAFFDADLLARVQAAYTQDLRLFERAS